jgi:hypothetical protein
LAVQSLLLLWSQLDTHNKNIVHAWRDILNQIDTALTPNVRAQARRAFRRRLERFVRRRAEPTGAGAPRNKPSVLRSSSRSGQ